MTLTLTPEMIEYATELPYNNNNGARSGLFGKMAAQIRLLGVKCGQILFSPPCSPPENLCLSEKNTKTRFFVFFNLMFFSSRLHSACESRSILHEGCAL